MNENFQLTFRAIVLKLFFGYRVLDLSGFQHHIFAEREYRWFQAINQDASGRHSNIGAVANNASAQIKSTPDQGGASSVHQESNNAKGKVSTSTNASYASTAQHDPAVASMQARANQQSSNGDYEPQAQTDSFKRVRYFSGKE